MARHLEPLQISLDRHRHIMDTGYDMANLSTREAAKKLGLAHSTLAQYIRVGKVPAPHSITSGGTTVHIWTEDEVKKVRKLLPKIANGRKTRWQKLREKQKKAQAEAPQPQHAKTARAGGPKPVPRKKKKK